MELRVVSWNVNCKSAESATQQLEALADADAVALQEVKRQTIESWREALAGTELSHVVDSTSRLSEFNTANVIASRWPLRAFPPLVTPRPERFLSAVAETELGPVELHNAHIPDGSSNGYGKVQGFVDLHASLARKLQTPRILCGDFNSPKSEEADGAVTFWGEPHELWVAAERGVLLGLRKDAGLVDAFRAVHGYREPATSWRNRRYDHVLASPALEPQACEYLEKGPSDHAPVQASFEWSGMSADPAPPIDIRGLLTGLRGATLQTARGREHVIRDISEDEVVVEIEETGSRTVVRVEWIEAAARRLQVEGTVDVAPSVLGSAFATIGAVLSSIPAVRWKPESNRVSRRWLELIEPAD